MLLSAQCTDVRVNQVAIDRPLRNVRAGDPVTSSIVGVTGSWFVTNPAVGVGLTIDMEILNSAARSVPAQPLAIPDAR